MPVKGCFETMPSYGGRVFAEDAHLKRLSKGCEILGIPAPPKNLLKGLLALAIKKNKYKDARLRLSIAQDKKRVKISLAVKNLASFKKAPKGFCVLLAKEKKGKSCLRPYLKSLDRRFYDRVFVKAKRLGFDEAIFCNSRGEVVEGTKTNVFVVRQGEVVTPSLKSGCLAGVTRKIILSLSGPMKIHFKERRLVPEDLLTADEIFLTNSILGVVGVVRLNERRIAGGREGSVTKKIRLAYQKEVEKECCLGYNGYALKS